MRVEVFSYKDRGSYEQDYITFYHRKEAPGGAAA